MKHSDARRKGDLDIRLPAGGLCEICNQPNPDPAPPGRRQNQCPACGRLLELSPPAGGLALEDSARR